MAARKYPAYAFLVVDKDNFIVTGNEFREDAQDFVRELKEDSGVLGLRILTPAGWKRVVGKEKDPRAAEFWRNPVIPPRANPAKSYIVLYQNKGRIGSVDNTPENLAELKRQFEMSLIQTDITGTSHYNVRGAARTAAKRSQEKNPSAIWKDMYEVCKWSDNNDPVTGYATSVPFHSRASKIISDGDNDMVGGEPGVPKFATERRANDWIRLYGNDFNTVGLGLHVKRRNEVRIPKKAASGLRRSAKR